jgi:transposase
VLAKTRQAPPDDSTHWSTRKLAKVMGVSHGLIAPGVAPSGTPAASTRALPAVRRPGFRAEGGGHPFLQSIVDTQPRRREIHVIVDNLSAHKTKRVQALLEAHPRVQLHFTPTYSSWLNQVELWFAKLERDLLARGIFTSIPDLVRKIRRYITRDKEDPKPIRWTYSTPGHRITTDSANPVH